MILFYKKVSPIMYGIAGAEVIGGIFQTLTLPLLALPSACMLTFSEPDKRRGVLVPAPRRGTHTYV